MMLSRRSMFAGLAATIAAPAIIRTPGLLMPIKAVRQTMVIGIDPGIEPGTVFVPQGSHDGKVWQTVRFAVEDGVHYELDDYRFQRMFGTMGRIQSPLNVSAFIAQ